MPSSSPDRSNHFHPLAGHTVVFTGKLSSLGRRDARALVARLGGASGDDVNARTTMLVVGAEGFGDDPGDDDESPDEKKSNKLKRAEELHVRVVTEEEFCRIAGITTREALKK